MCAHTFEALRTDGCNAQSVTEAAGGCEGNSAKRWRALCRATANRKRMSTQKGYAAAGCSLSAFTPEGLRARGR